jgi:hypothetical protein
VLIAAYERQRGHAAAAWLIALKAVNAVDVSEESRSLRARVGPL